MPRTRLPYLRRDPAAPSHLEAYLRDIARTPLLTAAEERELAHRVVAGDPEAREHMTRANLRLVVKIARGYYNRGTSVDLADLIEEGNLGLFRAVQKFDLAFNVRFSTYAGYWIKQSITRALEERHLVHVPAYAQRLGDLPEARPHAGKLARRWERKLRIRADAERAMQPTGRLRLDAERGPDGHGAPNEPTAPEPPDDAIDADDLLALERAMRLLDDRERAVIRGRFYEGRTLKQVGAEIGVTRERVRQIEGEALAKLREAMEPV